MYLGCMNSFIVETLDSIMITVEENQEIPRKKSRRGHENARKHFIQSAFFKRFSETPRK